MNNQLYPWKRELWQKGHPIGKWGVDYDIRLPSKTPKVNHKPQTSDVLKQSIVTQEAPADNGHSRSIYPYAFAVGVASGLLLIILVGLFLFSKKRNGKISKDATSASILVYPSPNGGGAPQFLTKEINFSLPPLRSNSMGDLEYQDNPYDSDVDTDTLLLPGQSHSTRSNSFSCYGLGVIEPSLYRSSMDLDEIEWPEGHIGRIWFSLRYEPSTEKLLVSLLKAKNLPSRTFATFNMCEPFVRVHLMPDERRYLQSKQKKKTCNPYFDETLVFQVSSKDMADHILKLTVIDGGRSKRHAEIGYVTYPLRDLEIGDGSEQQLFKMDLQKHAFENDHRVMWGETSILQKEPDKIKRKIKESACIYLNEDQCIANISVDINPVWFLILKQDVQKGVFKIT